MTLRHAAFALVICAVVMAGCEQRQQAETPASAESGPAAAAGGGAAPAAAVEGVVFGATARIDLLQAPAPDAIVATQANPQDFLIAQHRIEAPGGPWLAVTRVVTLENGTLVFLDGRFYVRESDVVRLAPQPNLAGPPPAPPPPGLLSGVTWLERPTAEDFARYYPARALDSGQEGRATLDCIVGAEGRLSCTVASEDPSGWGFGEASLRVSRHFRAAPATAGGQPTEGGRVRLPIAWRTM